MIKGCIFYSKKCQRCYTLMKIMEHQQILELFEKKCIDDMIKNMSTTDIANLGFSKVPTIIMINEQNGAKGIYEDGKAYEFIENMIKNRQQSISQHIENTRKIVQINEMKKRIKEGIFEYCPNESTGFSDNYAFWKDDIQKDIDMAQPKSYLPVGHDDKYGIMTIPDNKEIKNKLSKDDQQKLIKNLEKIRDTQDTTIKTIMEQEQLSTILNAQNIIQ